MNQKNGTVSLTEDNRKDADYRLIKETSSGDLLKIWKK